MFICTRYFIIYVHQAAKIPCRLDTYNSLEKKRRKDRGFVVKNMNKFLSRNIAIDLSIQEIPYQELGDILTFNFLKPNATEYFSTSGAMDTSSNHEGITVSNYS